MIGRFFCKFCCKSYSSKGSLVRHNRYECTYQDRMVWFKCPFCDHSSRRKDHLRSHVLRHMKFRKQSNWPNNNFNKKKNIFLFLQNFYSNVSCETKSFFIFCNFYLKVNVYNKFLFVNLCIFNKKNVKYTWKNLWLYLNFNFTKTNKQLN